MSRLYDRLLAENIICDKYLPEYKSAIVISGDNVSNYYYGGTDQEMWNIYRDFPNIAPPFDNFFVDCRAPQQIISKVEGIVPIDEFPFAGWGLWFLATPDDSFGAKWKIGCQLYLEPKHHKPIGPILAWVIRIMKDGKPRQTGDNQYDFQIILAPIQQHNKCIMSYVHSLDIKSQQEWCDNLRSFLDVGLLTISFLHCKNVVMKQANPPEKLQKKNIKKRGFPLVRYHVLDIEPMKQILKSEGNSEETGIKKALHICRGHFKDYTQGNGLFGKIKGLYWWDMFLRGDKHEGLILKDYNIKL